MERLSLQNRNHGTIFGRLLTQKLETAGLSIADLASLTSLSSGYLEELERGEAGSPNFDVCYKIAQAINSRKQQGFVIQDLWEAANLDRLCRSSRERDNQSVPVTKPVHNQGEDIVRAA